MGKTKEWKWGYIKPEGDLAITPRFDEASDFLDGLGAVKIDWARGYIDRSGEFVINPIFEAAGDFHDGVAVVKLDGETRCIDKDGMFSDKQPPVETPIFESGFNPHYEPHDGLVRFVENQKFGYKDIQGNVVIRPQYFEATDFSEGLACVKKGKSSLWGYIDTSGRTAIPPGFKQARPFHEGMAAVLSTAD